MTRRANMCGALLLGASLLAGCASQQGLVDQTPGAYLAAQSLEERPTPGRFSFCVNYGCARILPARLSDAAWRDVLAPLALPAATPLAERQALAVAVARFERAARQALGLGQDRAGTYPGAFAADQNDCVDETANTTTLLIMLDAVGKLTHHRVGPPAKRGVFINIALPHRTATLQEKASGARFVLDSWFRGSGEPADVAPLQDWLGGWAPPGGAWS